MNSPIKIGKEDNLYGFSSPEVKFSKIKYYFQQ